MAIKMDIDQDSSGSELDNSDESIEFSENEEVFNDSRVKETGNGIGKDSKNQDKDLNNMNPNVNLKREKKKKTTCKRNQKSPTKINLKKHVLSVHEHGKKIKNFSCNQCNYRATSNCRVDKHIRAVHDKIKDFSCLHCSYKTAYNHYLKSHIKHVHYGSKDFACEQCSYKATQLHALRTHVKVIHDKIKDLSCEQCNYITGQPANLHEHKKFVHDKVKDHACSKCNFRAARARAVFLHAKAVHDKVKDWACTYCEFRTAQSSRLQSHVDAVHKKLRKYICRHCDYKTSHAGGLKLHVNNAHNNIKHLACELCSYRTSYYGNLQKHVKIHHSLSYQQYKSINKSPLAQMQKQVKSEKTQNNDKEMDTANFEGNRPTVVIPLREVKKENDLEKEKIQGLDSDSSEESIIMSDDEEATEDSSMKDATSIDKAEEAVAIDVVNIKEALVKNPFFTENSKIKKVNKKNFKINLPPSYKAFLRGKAQLDKSNSKRKRAPCDLCSYVGSSQSMLTSHILEWHVSPD